VVIFTVKCEGCSQFLASSKLKIYNTYSALHLQVLSPCVEQSCPVWRPGEALTSSSCGIGQWSSRGETLHTSARQLSRVADLASRNFLYERLLDFLLASTSHISFQDAVASVTGWPGCQLQSKSFLSAIASRESTELESPSSYSHTRAPVD
jgi:hypothetical protein